MKCAKCGKDGAEKKCAQCHAVSYCSRDCQREHWKVHKKKCSTLAKEKQAGDAQVKEQAAAPQALATPALPAAPAAAAAPAAPLEVGPAAPPARQAIPCLPYTLPSNASDAGKAMYEKIKPILDTTPEQINNAIGETPFCVATEGTTKRIDTRIVYAFSEFLQEAIKADPNTAGEVFKRMLTLKIFLKHADHFLFANWCNVTGQLALGAAARARAECLGERVSALAGPQDSAALAEIEKEPLPKAVEKRVDLFRGDANAFLSMGMQFLAQAEASPPAAGREPPPAKVMRDIRNRIRCSLAYTLRHFPGREKQRQELFASVLSGTGDDVAEPMTRALSAYGAAHLAAVGGDASAFGDALDVAEAAYKTVQSPQILAAIARHRSLGICPTLTTEMGRLMDTLEIQFREQTLASLARMDKARNGGAEAAAGASGSNGSGSTGPGAKLVPGGKGAGKEAGAGSGGAAKPGGAAARPENAAVKAVEAEMRAGYALFQRNEMEAGIKQFETVLKKAFDLPKTGMSISVIFSASHAYIEGCAQFRRYGKADAMVDKLKELADYASENPIPYAIDTVTDRLQVWWREKRANLLSRQRKYDGAFSTLKGALPHAKALNAKNEAAIHMLMCSCQIDLALTGSAKFDVTRLQSSLDAGVGCLKSEPPPAGGAAAKGGAATPAWASEVKLEQWVRILPMLQSLEAEGVDASAAEALLLPLADQFGMEVGEVVENAEMFVANRMAAPSQGVSAMTVLFGLALALPVLLAVALALRVALLKPDAEEVAADGGFEEGTGGSGDL